ncbi:MAG: Gfo/Idh/MocA family oxidoreductase, partial [Vulcanimicrobiaceae bacterium]
VDHTCLYTGAVEKLRALFLEGAFGEIFYLDSVRINLGLFQQTASVIDDLGPHDVSIVNHLLGEAPLEVAAVGASHVKGDHSEVAFVTLRYPSGALAHLHLSWLSPLKVRRLMISGARRMAVWDDVEPSEKVRIYDKGVEFNPDPASNALRMVSYRTGDMIAPAIDGREALSKLAEDFYAAIVHGKRPRADATDGLTVVRVLDAANRSLKRGGAFEPLTSSLPVR